MFHSIRKIIFNKPWLPVVLLLALFLAGWVCFVTVAIRNQPRAVPVSGSSATSR